VTATIPIVMASGNPLEAGYVASLARPSGNVTGLTSLSLRLSTKRLELARELVPGASRFVVLSEDYFSQPGTITDRIVHGVDADPVTWYGEFATDPPGIVIQWKWAAAVYTQFDLENNALGVKPVDANEGSLYANSDHAGTPEYFKTFVIGGARGGGGSNYTGSYSGTPSVRDAGQGGCAPPD